MLRGRGRDLAGARRWVVIGTSGSGKSTFSQELSTRLSLGHVEIDALHWERSWTEAPTPLLRERLRQAFLRHQDGWVVDGNYGKVRAEVWPRAEVIVWLDYSFPQTFWRLLCRTFRRAWRRERLWSGNRESLLRAFFSRDSVLWWMIQTYPRHRRDFPRLLAEPAYAHLQVLRFRHPLEARAFLNALQPRPLVQEQPSPHLEMLAP